MSLHHAAASGDIETIRAAADKGIDANAPDKDGRTPLWHAAAKGHLNVCSFLIARQFHKSPLNSTILEAAVQENQIDVVRYLWSSCDAEKEQRSLEAAISLGFHDIADFLIGTLKFKIGSPGFDSGDGFVERPDTACQQWERFLFVRRDAKISLNRLYYNYALILAAKAYRNTGLKLMQLLLGEQNSIADVNSKIRINGQFDTPLTAAAMAGNLDILSYLLAHGGINVTRRGRYNWPAFLHLINSPISISTEKSRGILAKLFNDDLSTQDLKSEPGAPMANVFEQTLRQGDDKTVDQVIELIYGSAGVRIIPLLIRANREDGLRWILNSDIVYAPKPSSILWVVLCEYFAKNPQDGSYSLFLEAARVMVGNGLWHGLVSQCLRHRYFRFVQQFLLTDSNIRPDALEAVYDTSMTGITEASASQDLLREWGKTNFPSILLWSAIRFGGWKKPSFKNLAGCHFVNLDAPDPNLQPSPDAGKSLPQSPKSAANGQSQVMSPGQALKELRVNGFVAVNTPTNATPISSPSKQRKRQLQTARNSQEGVTPLAWALSAQNAQVVSMLLGTSRVNVNAQDVYQRTPLVRAIETKNIPILIKLMGCDGLKLNLRDDQGKSAIFYAVESGTLSIVNRLIATRKVDLSVKDGNGEIVIALARKLDRHDMVAAIMA